MYHHSVRVRLGLALITVLGLLALAGCGSSSSSSSSSASGGGSSSTASTSSASSASGSVDTSKCGTKPGVKATGTPLNIGTIDQGYWKQLGVYEMGAGIAPECWSTPNSAAVNMGPRYSSDGAVQYGLAQHPSKMVFVQSNVPGTGYIAAGPKALSDASHVPITELTENVPINDANSVALDLVNKAGSNGWVVLNFTPPEALVILQAAQKLGLENRVKGWGCSTPCNTDFLSKALGPKWNHKLYVNAELTSADDHNGPEMQLYKAILAKYGKSVAGGLGSFSEMGYLLGKFSKDALLTVKGPYTIQSANAAFKAIKDEKTELICQPWVYGDYPLHIPNNADFTTTPDNGRMVTAQPCFNISAADPQIAAYRKAAGTAPSTNPPTS